MRRILPPFEWYNYSISSWTRNLGLQLISFTPGTLSIADYTWPDLKNYKSSDQIYQSITDLDKKAFTGLNGFILLMHVGTDPRGTDKFYTRLPSLYRYLSGKYQLVNVDELLQKR